MNNEPRYIMRPTEGSTGRYQEIFDNLARETVASFKEQGRNAGESSEALLLAQKFLAELNDAHERTVQTREARHALIEYIDALPQEDLLRFQRILTGERGGYVSLNVYRNPEPLTP